MKKKKILILALIIAIIIGIIVGIFVFTKNDSKKEGKLQKIYDKLIASDQYSFEMEENESNKKIMAKRGEETSIDQYSDDEGHLTSLIKNGNTYLIYHNREEYYVYEKNNIEQNILTDGLKDILEEEIQEDGQIVIKKKEYSEGTEKLNGKKYNYEEYTGTTVFTAINALNIVEENVKTKFYFDNKDNLVYIKTSYGDAQTLLEIELKDSAENSLFEIPSNYAEN